ncbi:MAG: type ISP restriction/modification enzyme [Brevinema sp.]
MQSQLVTYYKKINQQKQIGADNEQNLRPIFYELLKSYTDAEELMLQYEQLERTLFNSYPDARLLRQGIPVGHVENKDAKDDLYKEIDKKLNDRNYPHYNILFENTLRAVLYQNGKRVEDIDMQDADELHRVLLKFVQYETNEQIEFLNALGTLKDILPSLAGDLRDFLQQEAVNNPKFNTQLQEFLQMCQQSMNKYVNQEDVIDIIIQHVLTQDIFIIFFSDANFHRENTISQTVDSLMNTLGPKKREIDAKIETYITVMRKYIHQMGKEDKKDVLKIFYEDFYTALNSKKADVQGVVYTPLAIVRFMIQATDELLYKHFDTNLSQRGVKILDPCTGTGIFLSEIIEFLDPKSLQDKYDNELFANEIDVLPYYIANLNIEYSYFEKTQSYKTFENICLIDTLEFQKDGEEQLFGMASFNDENLERAKRQYAQDISVVIGNPPYNANQKSENHNNKNKIYVHVDERIKNTYVKESTAQKTKQFDMYKRFIRWASDRLNEHGMISFITNNSYIDARQDDGFRKCVQNEFDYVYIVDLKGNARKNDKTEGQNVFNIMVGTAIVFLIKDSAIKEKKAKIVYCTMPDFANRQEKLYQLTSFKKDFKKIPFEQVLPSKTGQWLNFGAEDFTEHPALISKEVKNKGIGDEKAIFQLFSLGVATNRDNWAYDFNPTQLENKVKKMISVYDKERDTFSKAYLQLLQEKATINIKEGASKEERIDICSALDRDFEFTMKQDLDYSIKWSRDLLKDMQYDKEYQFNLEVIRPSLYRPFCKQYLAFQDGMIDVIGVNRRLFPTGKEGENICINMPVIGSRHGVPIYASKFMIDLNSFGDPAISVPLYRYEGMDARSVAGAGRTGATEDGKKLLNITDWGMGLFKERYGANITPEQVFAYCYGVLSSPAYQQKYADNLKTDYPRIPLYDDFNKFSCLGQKLIDLHAHYEAIEAYEGLKITRDDSFLPEGIENPNKNRVTHPMKIDKKLGVLHLDAKNRIEGIPLEAFDYKIGSRSAIDWVVEYHKFKKLNPEKELHHKTLIDEGLDTYNWKEIRAGLFDLVPRLVRVSVETLEVLRELGDGC